MEIVRFIEVVFRFKVAGRIDLGFFFFFSSSYFVGDLRFRLALDFFVFVFCFFAVF